VFGFKVKPILPDFQLGYHCIDAAEGLGMQNRTSDILVMRNRLVDFDALVAYGRSSLLREIGKGWESLIPS
jgi:hypothetical protein